MSAHLRSPYYLSGDEDRGSLDKKISPGTVNRELLLLSGFFNWLKMPNPVKGVKKLTEDIEQTRVVNAEEFREHLMACSQPLRDVATVMVDSGLRPGEIFNLTKDSIDFDGGRICITTGKTKAAKRKIRMTARVYAILSALSSLIAERMVAVETVICSSRIPER